MKSWPKVKLGEIAPTVPAAPLEANVVWLINLDAIESGTGAILRRDVVSTDKVGGSVVWFDEKNVLYSKLRPYLNKVVLPDGPGCATSELWPLRPDEKRLSRAFLTYFLRSKAFVAQISEKVAGAKMPRVVAKEFRESLLPLPPLDEQARIVAELDAVAATLKKRQTQLAELNALVEARFVELFGDPATNPKGWPTGTIRDIVSEVKYGTSKPATVDGRFNYLRMNNITYDGYLDLSDLKKIDVPEAEVEKYIVRQNDVLFNRTNSKELVGKTCVFDADEPMIIAGYIIRIRVNEKATPLFLSRFLNSRYGKTTLFNMCKAIVGQANINAQELQKIAIFIPPLELQERFAAEVERVEAVKTSVRAGIAETRTLFDALSQRYFG